MCVDKSIGTVRSGIVIERAKQSHLVAQVDAIEQITELRAKQLYTSTRPKAQQWRHLLGMMREMCNWCSWSTGFWNDQTEWESGSLWMSSRDKVTSRANDQGTLPQVVRRGLPSDGRNAPKHCTLWSPIANATGRIKLTAGDGWLRRACVKCCTEWVDY